MLWVLIASHEISVCVIVMLVCVECVNIVGLGVMNQPDSNIDSCLNDEKRIEYMKSYLDALLSAIRYVSHAYSFFLFTYLFMFFSISSALKNV